MEPAYSYSDEAPPTHVAVIMDGNGRWAESRGLDRAAGHQEGMEAARRAVTSAAELGISYLTLYGFSNENWNRPAREIEDLMGLLRRYLRQEVEELDRQGVRILFIGDRSRLADDIVALLKMAEQRTRRNSGLTLTIALSYSGRQEITQAAQRLARRAASGEIDPDRIDEAALGRELFTANVPDPDLVIRTSGEKRISNFLLWQCAYAEMVFLDTLWPDFSREDFVVAVREFHGRDRRFGMTRVG